MQISVFISHSTNQTTDKPFLEDLCQRLKNVAEAGQRLFDVFVDTDIQAGETWREKLLRTIGKCQASIVLLNEQAITVSDWVHTEAMLLRWRHWLDNDVVLILILLGQGTHKLFKETPKWRPLNFGEVQFLSVSQGELEFTDTTIDLAAFDVMVDRLKIAKKTETTFDKLRQGLKTQLNRAFSGSDIDVAEIEELVEGILANGPEWIGHLIDYYSQYFDSLPAPIESALELIAPWWVDPAASCVIARQNVRHQKRTAFCLNSSNSLYYKYTSVMYIRHAICLAPQLSKQRMVFVLGRSGCQHAHALIQEVLSDVRNGLKQRIGIERIANIELAVAPERLDKAIDEEISRWLDRQIIRRHAIFVVLPPHLSAHTDIINAIFARYAQVTLLLLTESREAARKNTHAKPLRPFLDPAVEGEAFDCYMDIKANFDEL